MQNSEIAARVLKMCFDKFPSIDPLRKMSLHERVQRGLSFVMGGVVNLEKVSINPFGDRDPLVSIFGGEEQAKAELAKLTREDRILYGFELFPEEEDVRPYWRIVWGCYVLVARCSRSSQEPEKVMAA